MLEFPKEKTTEERLLFLYGLLGTMPILQVLGFTAFTWLTVLSLGYMLLQGRIESKAKKKVLPYLIFSIGTLISSGICLVSNMPSIWKDIQPSNIIWQLCYLIIFIGYFNQKGIIKSIFYIKGVYYAAFAHAIWGILQFFIYEIGNISINKILFFDLLHVQMAEYVQMRGSSIAMTGFCWNAGNFAPLLVIGYVLSSSIYIKIFFAGIALLSGSRTGITGILASFLLELGIHFFKKRKGKIKLGYILGIGAIAVVAVVVIATNGRIMQSISQRIQEMQGMFSRDFLTTQSSSRLHARYWISIPRITGWNNLINNLFGYGIESSGYPFAEIYGQYADHAWTVECDFINILWSFGYIGFIIWYGWYGNQIIKGTKINNKYLILFAGLLVEGASYNVTFNWCLMFLLFVFTNISYSNDIFSKDIVRVRGLRSHAVIRNN